MDDLAERLKSMTPLQRAVFALKETQARLDAIEQKRSEPIAIVGMACRFPGRADSAAAFWRMLCEGVDAIGEVPADRWNADAFYDPDPAAPGKMSSRCGGFLERIDEFDNHFFGISDHEAPRIDPQQRLLLELAWEALEDAGLPPRSLRGAKIGVFVGISMSEYGMMLSNDLAQTDAYAAAGTSLCLAANRLSFAFGWHGPSFALDTACSSSLVAVHLACQHIRNGDCEAAVVGGSNLLLSPIGTVNLTKAGFCATDGRIRAFDDAASGYVRSEGAGLVVLKPLSAALKNNDPIYALIRGSAVNQNGSSNGLTAPSRAAQELVLREAYSKARVAPGDIQYVETQGTGTHLGDAIEATALGNVLREGRPAGSLCAIGSVKTNIGHMEAASGMASLMKAAMALKNEMLPPSLHFQTPNKGIPFGVLPIKVQDKLEPWPRNERPRFAGVSAFGFGGSNSHAVLQEPPALTEDESIAKEVGPRLLPVSARTEKALGDLVGRYSEFLCDEPPAWRDVCYTAALRREHHDCRVIVLADSPHQAAERLAEYKSNKPHPHVFSGRKPFGRDLKIAFLYGNQADSWKPFVATLAERIPDFTAAASEVDAALQTVAGRTLSSILSKDARLDATALAALQLAVTAWWRCAGISPDVVFGCGIGELSAACTAGVLTVEEVLQLAKNGGSADVKPRAAALPMLSALDGKSHVGTDLDAAHWRSCFGLAQGMAGAIQALDERCADIWLEIGPDTLADTISKLRNGNNSAAVVPSLAETEDGRGDVLSTVGLLYAAGADICWQPLVSASGRCVRLPTYPWQRQRLWTINSPWLDASPQSSSEESTPAARQTTETEIRERPDLTTPYIAPRNELEQTLAQSWAAVFNLDRIGIYDNFFELGGHSLMAVMAVSQIAERFQVDLPLRELFETPTIAALSERIGAAMQSNDGKRQMAITPIPRDGHLPLSFNQEALWFLDRLEPERPTYMLHLALNVRGPVDIPALERSLLEIARRHEVLRTTFPEVNGSPVQVISPPEERRLPVVDLSGVRESQREIELRRQIAAEMNKPIDLQNGPLFRLTMYRRAENDYAVVASTHHIIHDGWSMGVLLAELGLLYQAFAAGRPVQLPELPIQYVDFSAWQRRLLQGETLERLRTYWKNQLSGTPALELPTDLPRPAIRATRGSSRPCQLSKQTSDAVVEFCHREGVTPFMTLLTAFEALLARYSRQEDFAVGAPVANRGRPETTGLIGYFVNVVVLRANLTGDPTFREAVARSRNTSLEAFERQEMTLDQVVDAVQPPRDPSRNPIFQVMFALQNLSLPKAPETGIEITPLDDSPAPPSANFDLTLELFEREGGFQGGLSFSTDLFLPATIDRMVEQFETLVAAAVRQPELKISELPLLDPDQRQQMLVAWNDTALSYDRTRLAHHLFEEQAHTRPDTDAIVLDDRRWTYGQLNARANLLAQCLQQQGVAPETRVGVCLERSPELLMTVLGIMKAGGAYVPLDPAYTRDASDRIQYILEDAKVSLVVTDAALSPTLELGGVRRLVLDTDLPAENDTGAGNIDGHATADSLAYILYTSGSTGRPKGVQVTQGNLLNAYIGWKHVYRLDTDIHAHLQMASFAFDVFGGDMVRALCSGGKLVICRKEILLDAPRLCDLIRREAVEAAEFVPIVFRNLVQYLEETHQSLDCMKLGITGSDAWLVADHRRARRVFGPQVRLLNTYGLTETTIDSSYFEGEVNVMADGALTPIGRPFPNVQLYVLDQRMEPLPVGVPGELYIGGDGVSRGYVDPVLSAQRFIADPFSSKPDAKLCRTGDRALRRTDGQIEFLGRADNQVKIRGFRVEPGEVEQLLRKHSSLAEAAVAARPRTAGDLQLVAYVVGAADVAPDVAELRKYLAQQLPDYMVPTMFVALAALPTTNSGKIDRKALPEPDWSQTVERKEFVEPRTETERQLALIWSELLNIERVGATDNFFELGGNSLLALRLVARLRNTFSVDLPLVNLFVSSQLDSLAEQIVQLQATGSNSVATPILPRTRSGPQPISYPQERYWETHHRLLGYPLLNIHAALSVRGAIDLDALRKALNEVVRRHEALRTSFVLGDKGKPVQVIAPELTVDLPIDDLSDLSAEQQTEQVNALSRKQGLECFDLGRAPLFRLRLLRLGENEHVILATMHHIISDAWSVNVLFQEIAQLYDAYCFGHPSPLRDLPIQYADFTLWQREYLQGEVLDSLLDYWRKKLANLAKPAISYDKPKNPASLCPPKDIEFRISGETKRGLERLARDENATVFMLLMAAYQLMLRHRSGTNDLFVQFNIANRNRRETQELIGVFTNRLFLRNNYSGNPSFREALARVRQSTLEAYAHQELPVEVLLARLFPNQGMAEIPGVHACFGYHQRASAYSLQRHRGMEFQYLPTPVESTRAHYNLWLTITETENDLACELEYDSDLFDDATVEHMTEQYLNLLDGMIAHPEMLLSELSSLCDQKRQTRPASPEVAPISSDASKIESLEIPFVHELAASLLEPSMAGGRSLAPLRPGDSSPALFCIHGMGGHITSFQPLASKLVDGHPVYGLQGLGLDPGQQPQDSIEDMAAHYWHEIRTVQPKGPYYLAGWSMGGLIAIEMARQLGKMGQEVAMLALLDTHLSLAEFEKLKLDDESIIRWIAPHLEIPVEELKKLPLDGQWERIAQEADLADEGFGVVEIRRLAQVCRAHLAAMSRYSPQPYSGRTILFQAKAGLGRLDPRWKSFCPHLSVEHVPGNHYSMLRRPDVDVLAERIGRYMKEDHELTKMTRNQ